MRLDCTKWTATFEPNTHEKSGSLNVKKTGIPAGGYGGLGIRLPQGDVTAEDHATL